MATSKDSRDRSSGQYTHSKWSRLCKLCGHPVGMHTAEKSAGMRPCIHGDFYSDDYCDCPVFTSSKDFMSDDDYKRYSDGDFTAAELKALRAKGSKSNAELEKLGADIARKNESLEPSEPSILEATSVLLERPAQ